MSFRTETPPGEAESKNVVMEHHMRWLQLASVTLLALGLAGCHTTQDQVSSRHHGLLGIAFGNETDGVTDSAAVTAISTLLKDQPGVALDTSDSKAAADAQMRALSSADGSNVATWANEDTGHSGTVTSGPTYEVNSTSCREITHRILGDGSQNPVVLHATACKGDDGSWQILS